MCAERMQRVLIAILLGVIMGLAGSGEIQIAFLLQLALILLLLFAGLTGICPSLNVLRRFLPSCTEGE